MKDREKNGWKGRNVVEGRDSGGKVGREKVDRSGRRWRKG